MTVFDSANKRAVRDGMKTPVRNQTMHHHAFLRGCDAATGGEAKPPMNNSLRQSYNDGEWAVRMGYVQKVTA